MGQSVSPNATHLATSTAPHPRIEKLGGNSRQVSFNTDFDGLSRGFFKSKCLRTTHLTVKGKTEDSFQSPIIEVTDFKNIRGFQVASEYYRCL